jgi:signal transduction histidine kinase
MEKFAKSLDGTFLIESKIGSGTTLTISVPEQENRKSDNDN